MAEEYTPTAAEQKILTVLADPDRQHLNIKQLCEHAGVNRGVFYKAMKKPGFAEYYKRSIFDLIQSAAGDMVKVAIQQAKEGNHNYFKTLMEMGSLYVPKQQQEITAAVKVEKVDLSNLTDTELDSLEAILSKTADTGTD